MGGIYHQHHELVQQRLQGQNPRLDGSHHVLDVVGDLADPVSDLGVALRLDQLDMLQSGGRLRTEHFEHFQVVVGERHTGVENLHHPDRSAPGAPHRHCHH